ncbi:hypothetical protein EDD11_010486 [Mortierella claussenii]|nr:hypothetical protein EDD11_010486 [Mortierella claussenii]
MVTFVEWATTVKVVDGQQQEHVSFPSFVTEFELLDKDDAIKLYEELLESPRLKLNRRDRLKANYAEFSKRRLDAYWSSWENGAEMETVQKELEHNAAIVAKKTAVVTSRQDSSRISDILRAQKSLGNTRSTKLSATAAASTSIHLQNSTFTTSSSSHFVLIH